MTLPAADRKDPNIGSVVIDPSAETSSITPDGVTGKQESDFYDRSRRLDELHAEKVKLGWLGQFWGAASAAPTNIAGLVTAVAIIGLLSTLPMDPSPDVSDIRKGLIGLISSCLAFVFGAATKKSE